MGMVRATRSRKIQGPSNEEAEAVAAEAAELHDFKEVEPSITNGVPSANILDDLDEDKKVTKPVLHEERSFDIDGEMSNSPNHVASPVLEPEDSETFTDKVAATKDSQWDTILDNEEDRDHEYLHNRSGSDSESDERSDDATVHQRSRRNSIESSQSSLRSSPSPETSSRKSPAVFSNYQIRHHLHGHKRAVSSVKISPDGRLIVSGSADATLKVWSIEQGKLLETLQGHLAGISTVAWGPDSQTVASGSDDKTIRLWNVAMGKQYEQPLEGHANYIYSLAFSPKGNMLVSGSYDEAVILWDVRSRQMLRTLPAHSDPIGGVDFVCDGTLVVSCASDGLIRIWDTGTGQCLRTLVHEDNPPVTSVCFSPNGKYVCAWTLDNSIRLWNYIEGRCVKTYQGHSNKKYSLAGSFGIYGPPYRESPQQLNGQEGKMLEVGETEDDGRDNENTAQLENCEWEERAFVVSGSEDGRILWWDVISKDLLSSMDGHDGVVLGVDCQKKSRGIIVTCGFDTTIKIWDCAPLNHPVLEDDRISTTGKEPALMQENLNGIKSEDIVMTSDDP